MSHCSNNCGLAQKSILFLMLRLLYIFILMLAYGCDNNPTPDNTANNDITDISDNSNAQNNGCPKCHPMRVDKHHDFPCSYCHSGNEKSSDSVNAHHELIRQPAHPDNVMKSCGECHEQIINAVNDSLHATLSNSINLIRTALGAKNRIKNLTQIPVSPQPQNLIELGDDLLRRRCLRCHLYFEGDDYPAVQHPTGCGSCHLNFSGDGLSHTFLKKPTDKLCLQCHYGNRVGFDYYGRFEHDLNKDYTTPFSVDRDQNNYYGINYRDLAPDIHYLKGLSCIDCHSGKSLMSKKSENNSISCRSCHEKNVLNLNSLKNIVTQNGFFFLRSSTTQKLHKIPFISDPAHNEYNQKIACQACHAQWSFNDKGTHLLRSDTEDYDLFNHLINQESSEVSSILETSLDFEKDDPFPVMTDKITREKRTGLWYKGFEMRRWETVLLGRDKNNTIRVMRPILDLYLSWVDEDEKIRFDSVPIQKGQNTLLPYTPHTTGKAGLFYRDRIRLFLQSEKNNTEAGQAFQTVEK